jgi:hypothetical protein
MIISLPKMTERAIENNQEMKFFFQVSSFCLKMEFEDIEDRYYEYSSKVAHQVLASKTIKRQCLEYCLQQAVNTIG